MKRFIHTFALAVSLTGATTHAADQTAHEGAHARMQELVDQLDLSAEQKAAIAPIMQDQATELRALKDNSALNRRHKIKRAREINEAASTRIRALLTSDQQVRYDALREEARAQMREQFKARQKERHPGEAAGGN